MHSTGVPDKGGVHERLVCYKTKFYGMQVGNERDRDWLIWQRLSGCFVQIARVKSDAA